MTAVSPEEFLAELQLHDVDFFVGVPDSLLKEFCAFIDEALPNKQHHIAANEGTAVGIAAGYHLATGRIPLVYMQNSGLGNAINPLLSLVDREVYAIPMLLMVGWRGRPGVVDEPQHQKQGRVTKAMLDAMEIPIVELHNSMTVEELRNAVSSAIVEAKNTSGPACLLVSEGVFTKYNRVVTPSPYRMSREDAIKCVVEQLPAETVIVATTGKISRELYEIRSSLSQSGELDFLTVGSMGHASQIALGIAMASSVRRVVCLDGDGAAIMHMGGLTSIGVEAPQNYVHILLNNGAHESVGGQPTAAFSINMPKIAEACGYKTVFSSIDSQAGLIDALNVSLESSLPAFIETRVSLSVRKDLGRPKSAPRENKQSLMRYLNGQE